MLFSNFALNTSSVGLHQSEFEVLLLSSYKIIWLIPIYRAAGALYSPSTLWTSFSEKREKQNKTNGAEQSLDLMPCLRKATIPLLITAIMYFIAQVNG